MKSGNKQEQKTDHSIQYLRNNFGLASFKPQRTVSQRFKVGLHLRQVRWLVRFMSKTCLQLRFAALLGKKKRPPVKSRGDNPLDRGLEQDTLGLILWRLQVCFHCLCCLRVQNFPTDWNHPDRSLQIYRSHARWIHTDWIVACIHASPV